MFDKEHRGYIFEKDLQTILKSLGRDPEEAEALLREMDFSANSEINFKSFLKIMRQLEDKMVQSKQEAEENEPKEAT